MAGNLAYRELYQLVNGHDEDILRLTGNPTILNILECTPIAQFAIGMDHRITQWNKACERLTGYAATDMVGTKRQWEPFYPKTRPVLADLIVDNNCKDFKKLYMGKKASKSKIISNAYQANDFFKDLGGIPRHVFFLAAPILNSTGKVIGAVETLQDITEQIQFKKDLRASEERYRILAEQIADGVILIQNGKIQFVNNTCVRIFGYFSPKDLLGKDPAIIVSEPYQETFEQMKKAFKTGKSSEKALQIQCLKKGGSEFWVEINNNVIQWEGRPALLATVRDVTKNKLRELAAREKAHHLKSENDRLKSSMKDHFGFGKMVGKSTQMQKVYAQILKAASSTANVVVYGESGTGKELVARSIHDMGDRRDKEFITVNCGAIPEHLIESEFFGYKKGAFTGANIDKRGYLESADGGTLFLDEVGELSLSLQVKLLRAIEGCGFTPIGSTEVKKTDVRIIAATNRNLKDHVKNGLMREDFFYRIHIVPIHIPPLRQRKDDLPLLVYHFMQKLNGNGKTAFIPERFYKAILDYNWPGNVRELQNAIHRYLTFNTTDFIDISRQSPDVLDGDANNDLLETIKMRDLRTTLENFEKNIIVKTLKQNNENRTQTAKELGLERRSLQRKLKRFGIQ